MLFNQFRFRIFFFIRYSILTEPQQGPPRLRLLCAYVLRENGPTPSLRIESFDPPLDRKQIFMVLPLMLATGNRKIFKKHFDQIVKWVIAAEYDVRVSALITLSTLSKSPLPHQSLWPLLGTKIALIFVVREGLPIKDGVVDIQIREFLKNASTVSAAQSSSLACKGWSSVFLL